MLLLGLVPLAAAALWPSGSFPLGYAVESYPASMSEKDFDAELEAAATLWVDDCAGPLFEPDDDDPEVLLRVGDSPEASAVLCEDGRCTIWLGEDTVWTTQSSAYEQACEGVVPAEEVLAYQLGTVLGLEGLGAGTPNTDPGLEEAVMYWLLTCDEEVALNSNDVEHLERSYEAPPRLLVEDEEVVGELALGAAESVTAQVSDEVPRSVSWTLGEVILGEGGAVEVGPLEPGVHTLRAAVDWENALCGPRAATLSLAVRVWEREESDAGSPSGEHGRDCSGGASSALLLLPLLWTRRRRGA